MYIKNNRNKGNKYLWIIPILAIAFILIIFMLYSFTESIKKDQQVQNRAQMTEIAYQKVQLINCVVDERIDAISTLSEALGKYDNLRSKEAVDKLKIVAESSKYDTVAIDFLDGSSITSEGYMIADSGLGYIDRLKAGETIITDAIKPEADEKVEISIIVPIKKGNAVVAGARGTMDTISLADHFSMGFWDGKGEFVLQDSNGESIAASKGASLNPLNRKAFFVVSVPCGIENWELHVMVQREVIRKYEKNLEVSAATLVLQISVILFLLFLFIILIMKISNDKFKEINEQLLIKDKKELEEKYREAQIYKNALDSDRVAIFEVNLTKDYFMTGYNDMLEMSGMQEENCYSKIQSCLLENYVYEDDKKWFDDAVELSNLLRKFSNDIFETVIDFRIKVNQNKYAWSRYKFRTYKDPISNDICCILTLVDINAQKCRELELMEKAELDQLTMLYNKTTTERMIKDFLLGCDNTMESNAFLIIDIDNFKNVNDILGHLKGDMVLRELATKLRPIFRSNDILGRLGGDEFFVFMKNCLSKENAMAKARKVNEEFYLKVEEESKSVDLSASIGIAVSPGDGTTFEELYKKADSALYCAKKNGKNTFA